MYGQQQFVPGSMYQQGMMQYPGIIQSVGAGMSPGAMMNYQQFRPGFPQAPSPQQQHQPPMPQQQWQRNGPQQNYKQREGGYKQRNNEIGNVSPVVHLRNVTPDVTQLSIQNLAQHFGNIKHIVMLRQMNQALVEMESVKSAQELVDFCKEAGYAEIDGRRVYVRYSNHKNLTATHHVSQTLLVSMFNTQYDVSVAVHITPEIVYRIFTSYGALRKIVVLPKNESSQWNHNRVQALVQFDSQETAEDVKNTLQGQPVTLGDTITFTLDIQFSKMDEIKTTNPTRL
ncbi:putative RNA-binding protein [Angomonas deanei]|uniref:RNA recognition motif. (A.k.a. RRM, RBD, or RNP domain), putative n=1 Tax=Angomonas deanei TaxID=59799 RepID=A0A7G2CMJ6_9TRYP|nr:putative RNA-binding protein [Angomonas deanei]CAD2220287.1 RNA recognition motif. (a.k.a. RRM, RBD, or RNP domain), putative [Angomonas deanei]|eukprot:EPY26684.1 putative RNA-binding protein [Angomonas deanei]